MVGAQEIIDNETFLSLKSTVQGWRDGSAVNGENLDPIPATFFWPL